MYLRNSLNTALSIEKQLLNYKDLHSLSIEKIPNYETFHESQYHNRATH